MQTQVFIHLVEHFTNRLSMPRLQALLDDEHPATGALAYHPLRRKAIPTGSTTIMQPLLRAALHADEPAVRRFLSHTQSRRCRISAVADLFEMTWMKS